jgi:4-hydroxy-3-methylbut-2-enyl diphosphate reductase
LIDGADDIRPEWLESVRRVGVTAGASAPESLVSDVVERLRQDSSASLEELEGVAEHMEFALPKQLRIKNTS